MSAASKRGLLGVCAAAAVVACTPLGVWVYDDPGLEVSRVRVDHDGNTDPVVLSLAVWNPNDYDVSTSRLELELKLDDVPVGRFSRDSVVAVPTAGLADVALPLTVPRGAARQRIRDLSAGAHRFAVEGRAIFSTPFGPRKVRFAHAGDLAFRGATEARIHTTIASDSLAVRGRRGIYVPRLPEVPDQGLEPVMREPRAEPVMRAPNAEPR
ncbi:MAG TPA: LEA type 2 family protein [Gemmatimonadales bacterium]|jgi:LEA14-like dessication related protein